MGGKDLEGRGSRRGRGVRGKKYEHTYNQTTEILGILLADEHVVK